MEIQKQERKKEEYTPPTIRKSQKKSHDSFKIPTTLCLQIPKRWHYGGKNHVTFHRGKNDRLPSQGNQKNVEKSLYDLIIKTKKNMSCLSFHGELPSRDPLSTVASILVQGGACAWGWYALTQGGLLFNDLCGATGADVCYKAIGLAAFYRAWKHSHGPNWKKVAFFDE